MRSTVFRHGALTVADVPEPEPGPGELLVAVKACGICASDLLFAAHSREIVDTARAIEGDVPFAQLAVDLNRDVYLGHEFCAEVLDFGPGTIGPQVGTAVVSMPGLLVGSGVRPLVFSNDHVCGYSERMVISAALALSVPNGLDPQLAAVTEPIAVGVHAVNRAALQPGDRVVVTGCGPIGLAIIAVLRALGVESIVGVDPSAPRREIASAMGATSVVDPRIDSPFASGSTPVVFEATGVPGVLDNTMRIAPRSTKIVVAGVCMQRDFMHQIYGASKEVDLVFANGYSPEEFAQALHYVAEGVADVRPMITGRVGLDGVATAFDELADPDRQCKILVTP